MGQHAGLAERPHEPDCPSCSSDDEEEEEMEEEMSPWIEWFLSQPQNDFFCEVDEEYLLDRFNLTGLTSACPHFQLALDRITLTEEAFSEDAERVALELAAQKDAQGNETDDRVLPSAEDHILQLRSDVQASASHLYGLIHARFILTTQGLSKMVGFYFLFPFTLTLL